MTKKMMLEQYPRVSSERDRLDLMLHDVTNNHVTFGDWVREPDGSGKYRVGISRMSTYPLCMVTWRAAGQNDSVTVMDLERYEPELRTLRNGSECWEPVCKALQSAKNAVRAVAAVAA